MRCWTTLLTLALLVSCAGPDANPEELIDSRLLKEEPTKDKTGYNIRLRPTAAAGSYTLLAGPATPTSDERFFFSNKSGEIRVETGKPATASSPLAQ